MRCWRNCCPLATLWYPPKFVPPAVGSRPSQRSPRGSLTCANDQISGGDAAVNASPGASGVTLWVMFDLQSSLLTDRQERLCRSEAGADKGVRTPDLRFTRPLLYQLSYVGTTAGTPAARPW